jgi:alkaline phosphatase D
MRAEGAFSHRMIPVFPTISLVNGISISTGCWPESHGVVTNKFLDPEKGLYDHSRDADWLTGCEHLHVAAERQGIRSAALGWYGARSGTRGSLATHVDHAERWEDFPEDRDRAREVVGLLALPGEQRPRLILAYLRGPDRSAHFEGQGAPETVAAIQASDASVGAVLSAVDALPDRDDVTVVVTTDHGMRPVTHVVNIERILARHGISARPVSTGTTSFLYFDDPGDVDGAVKKLAGYEEFDLLRPGDAPAWSHVGTSPRAGDLIVSARPPYYIEDADLWPAWARWLVGLGPDLIWTGLLLQESHGYPPDTPGVEGIFYAWGSGIAPGRELPRVDAIDIHPTVTRLLGIEPGRPVDGRVVRALLSDPPGGD